MALVLPALTDCQWWFESPAGPLGSLKCDPPKGNGRRPKKKIPKNTTVHIAMFPIGVHTWCHVLGVPDAHQLQAQIISRAKKLLRFCPITPAHRKPPWLGYKHGLRAVGPKQSTGRGPIHTPIPLSRSKEQNRNTKNQKQKQHKKQAQAKTSHTKRKPKNTQPHSSDVTGSSYG